MSNEKQEKDISGPLLQPGVQVFDIIGKLWKTLHIISPAHFQISTFQST